MGLNGRLVITPLTDRIYLTVTQVSRKRLNYSTENLNYVSFLRLYQCSLAVHQV